MNINLVYEGKDYNFDIPNGVTIDYLKDLSSKIFNSEKDLLDLIYNNEKVSNNDNNILIRDLIPDGETNAVLTVQLNKNLKNNTNNNNKQITPLVNLKRKTIVGIINEDDENITSENNEKKENKKKQKIEKKNTLNTENMENIQISKNVEKDKNSDNPCKSGRESRNNNIFLFNTNTNSVGNNNTKTINNNKVKLIFNSGAEKIVNNNFNSLMENSKKIFIETKYIKKYNTLLTLIKQFNEKIRKIHTILYKKFKNAGVTSNNISHISSNNTSRTSSINNISINNNYFYELSLYEKKLLNFQDKQIQFYKNLLEIMKNYDNDNDINLNKLKEFYNKLIIFSLIDNNNNTNIEQLKPLELKNIPSKKLINSNSSIVLSTLNSMNSISKLPIIKAKNPLSPIINQTKRNIITSNVKRINSFNYSNNMNCTQINENKENIKKSTNNINNSKDISKTKRIKSNYNDDNNNNNSTINKTNNKNNNINRNPILKKNTLSEDSSSENNDNLATNNIKKKRNLFKSVSSVKNVINYLSPLLRKDTKSNYKVKKLSDRYNYEKYEKEKGNNPMNIINEEKNIRSSIRHVNKSKNSTEKKIIFEDLKKNENLGGNMSKRIKEINISTMTVNDSNFAREKYASPKKNKKDTFNNKYDFLV